MKRAVPAKMSSPKGFTPPVKLHANTSVADPDFELRWGGGGAAQPPGPSPRSTTSPHEESCCHLFKTSLLSTSFPGPSQVKGPGNEVALSLRNKTRGIYITWFRRTLSHTKARCCDNEPLRLLCFPSLYVASLVTGLQLHAV